VEPLEERGMGINDFIWRRGEAIAFTRLVRVCRTDSGPAVLWPHYLGEKSGDVRLPGRTGGRGGNDAVLLRQVKTTRKEFTKTQTPPRLRVEVSAKDVRRMVAYPAPTYVVACIRTKNGLHYSVHGSMSESIPSITTGHEFDLRNPETAVDEVLQFWQGRDMRRPTSSFS